MEHTRIIISDLHVGQNDDFDIFANPGSNKHALLTGFLNHVRQQPNPIDLVINGDFIDFLQLRPWGDLSRGVALKKIKAIVANSPTVFNDLGTFLKDSRHKLKILPGNHDVELAYPEVGQVLRDAILQSAPGAEDRLDLFGPPSATRTTYRPKINGVLVQIEHGNVGDPWNSLNYTTLFNDAETGTMEFSYPPGTKMVYGIMNDFKEKLSFVDLLKPEMPAVVLILLAIKPFMAALGIPGVALKGLGAVGNSVLAMLRRKIGGKPLGPKPAVGGPTSDADDLEAFLSNTFPGQGSPTDWDMEVFLGGNEVPGVSDPNLGPKLTRVRLWFLSWALQALARFQAVRQGEAFFNTDHPDNPAAIGARSRLIGNVKVVVFGHTHEALKTEFAEGLYVNSGTWADLVGLPQEGREAMLKWLEDIAANKFDRTAYPTYVRIEPADNGVFVSLNLWNDAGERQLWAKNI
jgi:UDP-2,3-diacylglucosamine pyrophosphatase LpxH